MNNAIETLLAAQARGMALRPKVGGFPTLAEALRQAGVQRLETFLPSCHSLYATAQGPVATVGMPPALLSGAALVPPFNQASLINALRADQAGHSSFPEFLQGAWEAGVVRYVVEFEAHQVRYVGCAGEEYVESYSAVEI